MYGMSVEGNNFTDREKEQARLRLDFENGINVVLISPRRMGKTSLVRKVISEIDNQSVLPVYMDIYDCRSEYEFYNRFASSILKATAGRMEQLMADVRQFLSRVSPKISFGNDTDEVSLSLGITPHDYQPDEILNLPETIATDKKIRIVVCIDEFQQIGEFNDSLTVQKRLRGAWQHHRNVSYCLFGSKKHLMENIFRNRRMPFYQFGELMNLTCIPTKCWVPFICRRFAQAGKHISEEHAKQICQAVQNHSSYVQQLAWNVMAESPDDVTDESLQRGIEALLNQCDSLFVQQTERMSEYQLNFIRALCSDVHTGFLSEQVMQQFRFGSKSNLERIKKTLLEREFIEVTRDSVQLCDAMFALWFRRRMMR